MGCMILVVNEVYDIFLVVYSIVHGIIAVIAIVIIV